MQLSLSLSSARAALALFVPADSEATVIVPAPAWLSDLAVQGGTAAVPGTNGGECEVTAGPTLVFTAPTMTAGQSVHSRFHLMTTDAGVVRSVVVRFRAAPAGLEYLTSQGAVLRASGAPLTVGA